MQHSGDTVKQVAAAAAAGCIQNCWAASLSSLCFLFLALLLVFFGCLPSFGFASPLHLSALNKVFPYYPPAPQVFLSLFLCPTFPLFPFFHLFRSPPASSFLPSSSTPPFLFSIFALYPHRPPLPSSPLPLLSSISTGCQGSRAPWLSIIHAVAQSGSHSDRQTVRQTGGLTGREPSRQAARPSAGRAESGFGKTFNYFLSPS